MHESQIERLKKDSRALGYHIKKLRKRGRDSAAVKLAKKQSFLNAAIAEIQ